MNYSFKSLIVTSFILSALIGDKTQAAPSKRSCSRAFELAALMEKHHQLQSQIQTILKEDQSEHSALPRPGYLFSMLSFSESSFASKWVQLRKTLKQQFPDFFFTKVEGLHITLVYIGGEWSAKNLLAYQAAEVDPKVTQQVGLGLDFIGRNNNMLALHLEGIDPAWGSSIIATKKNMVNAGVKSQDRYDDVFKPHITLAKLKRKNNINNDQEVFRQLDEIKKIILTQVGSDHLQLLLSAEANSQLMLAGAFRPKDAPEYISIKDYLNWVEAEIKDLD